MKEIYKNDWIVVYLGLNRVTCTMGPASYFDDRAYITLTPTLLVPLIGIWFTGFSLLSIMWLPFLWWGYGTLYIDLPIRSGVDECDPPRYGFYWYAEGPWWKLNAFVWCWKKRAKHFYMPWSWEWFRTSKLRKDETWEHELRGYRKDFYKDEWNNIIWSEIYPYTYVLKNGEVQNRFATISVEEREWRWRWFMWIRYPCLIRKTISVEFSYGGPIDREVLFEKIGHPIKQNQCGEVGEQAGSWKGGTLGCSWPMLSTDTPLSALRTIEKNRIFN